MISKQCFCQIMDALENQYCIASDVYGVSGIDMEPISMIADRIVDALIEELGDVDDKNTPPCIVQYIINYDFGKSYEDGDYIAEVNGVKYAPKSSEELYDLIIMKYVPEVENVNPEEVF